MKISTTLGGARTQGHGRGVTSMEEGIKLLHETGFRFGDLSLTSYDNRSDYLWADDWMEQTQKYAQLAKDCGIDFYQGHAPFIRTGRLFVLEEQGLVEEFHEYLRRSIIAAGEFGVKWMVIHPLTFENLNCERKASLQANHDFWAPYVELGAKHGVGIAFENQLPYLQRQGTFCPCSHYEDLCDLIDSYNDPRYVGACWDTGHANQARFDQYRALTAVGSRLQVLHINDNHYGNKDEHLLPWMGEIKWVDVIRALVEINYPGSLNYEVGKIVIYSYGEAHKQMLRLIHDNASYFAQQYEKELIRQGKK